MAAQNQMCQYIRSAGHVARETSRSRRAQALIGGVLDRATETTI
jgi:hypothetical protein